MSEGYSNAANLPCPAWVFASGSNVDVAKDRSWFVTYVPFRSKIVPSVVGGEELAVHGVGAAEIPVKIRHGVHRKLHLEGVLHVPDMLCNIVGPGLMQYNISLGGRSDGCSGLVEDRNGPVAARLKQFGLLSGLQLSGPPVGPTTGPSPFEPGMHYWIRATWPEAEEQRWIAYKRQLDNPPNSIPRQRYTPAEKAWLKKNWGGEYHFLRSFGLSIYKEEDRDEGAAIVRAFMEHEEEMESSMDEESLLYA